MYCFSLIKQGAVHTNKKKIIPKEEFATLMSAQEILLAVKEEEKEVIKEANIVAEELKKAAEERGFDEGLFRFNEQILLFEEKVKMMRHEMQKALLPLVLKATKRIIGEEIGLNPEAVVHIVMQSIKSVSNCQVVKLFVNKADLEELETHKPKIKEIFERLESLEIEERADVARGSCIIQTEKGILNATLENQYRALERAFETHMQKR